MPEFVITGTGATTSVGFTAAQSYSSIRAGISRLVDHPLHTSIHPKYSVNEPEPLCCSPVATINPLTPPKERLLKLALSPLEEVFSTARIQREDVASIGLFLAVTPEIDGIPEWGMNESFVPEFMRQAALPDFPVTVLKRQGATGFFQALSAAEEALSAQTIRFALVGAADSFLDEASVLHFDETYRLLSERNPDGFVPGEGAAFVIVEPMEHATQRGASVLATLRGVAFGHEPNHALGELNSSGVGLGQVFEQLLKADECPEFWVLPDFNGESYRAYEWGLICARLGRILEHQRDLWLSAHSVGHLRAAGPALNVSVACHAFSQNDAPADTCLVFCGDDQGARAGCVLETFSKTKEP